MCNACKWAQLTRVWLIGKPSPQPLRFSSHATRKTFLRSNSTYLIWRLRAVFHRDLPKMNGLEMHLDPVFAHRVVAFLLDNQIYIMSSHQRWFEWVRNSFSPAAACAGSLLLPTAILPRTRFLITIFSTFGWLPLRFMWTNVHNVAYLSFVTFRDFAICWDTSTRGFYILKWR